jgi:tetratricopeptide (TPR) repeat protein
VGCALEKVYAKKIDEHFGELASHFLESGDNDKALDYFLKAGDKAAKIYANSEATFYFQSALTLLEEKEGETREKARVLERLGDIKGLVGEYDPCIKLLDNALQLWTELGEGTKAAGVRRKLANVLWEVKGEPKRAKADFDEAVKLLEGEAESPELAHIYDDISHMYWRNGDLTEALPWAQKAVGVAERLKAFDVAADSYLDLGTVYGLRGDVEKAMECLEKALKMALDNHCMDTAIRAYINLGATSRPEDYEKVLDLEEKAHELAKKVGDISHQSWIGTGLGWDYLQRGIIDRAMALVNESVTLDRKTGSKPHLSMSLGVLGFAHQVLGDWDKAERNFKESLSIFQGLQDFQTTAGGYGLLAWFYCEKGEPHKAREYGQKMLDIAERTESAFVTAGYAFLFVPVLIELGEFKRANSIIVDVTKSGMETKNRVLIARANVMKAMLLGAQKKWNESTELFEKTIQELDALNMRKWDVYLFTKMFLLEYARVLSERNQEGDREKASKLLNQALETFQKMGAKKDIEKVEARLLYIETGKEALVPKPTELVATGYADLDKLLCGGLLSSSALVLASPSCNERDSLIKSFLETGAKNGEVTFYVTIDPSLVRNLANVFQSNFYLFVCNPQADAIVGDSRSIFKLKGVENLTDISIALTSAIHKLDPSLKGPRRICIGLVSDVLLQHHAVQTRRWLTGLISELRANGFTTLAVMDPEMHPSQEVRAVLDLFEGQIDLYEKETEKGSEKFLKIKKMANQRYLKDELLLKEEDMQK